MSDPQHSNDSLSTRHPNYFLDTVVFAVEGYLFKVPKYHFLNKRGFPVNLGQHQQGANAEGNDETNPIVLTGVTKVDFQNLMKIMYPLQICDTQSLSYDEWVSVLKLSTKWRFVECRQLAIAELSDLCGNSPTTKILLGREYRVSRWLMSGYEQLARRSQMISHDEAKLIDYPTAFSVCIVREEISSSSLNCVEAIRREFEKELTDIEADERGYGSAGWW